MKLMAIANFTDNSFVRGDRMGELSFDDMVSAVGGMLSDGADIIDIGACSTAPGNPGITAECEWARLKDRLSILFESFPDTVFSLDCYRPEVVAKACRLAFDILKHPREQFIINDISSDMPELAAEKGLCYIAMCNTADPYAFFTEFRSRTLACGLDNWILDPGFGFGKSMERNWEILNGLDRLLDFGRPVLAALSRKRMIYLPSGLDPDSCAAQSVAAERIAINKGAEIIRTHDVAAHRGATGQKSPRR